MRAFVALFFRLDMRDDLLTLGIHETNMRVVFVEISPIINQIFRPRQIYIFLRSTLQPAANYAGNLRSAIPRHFYELAYR